ncbi:MAG: RluA family pseudouridine synthase [bacterium]
MATRQLKITAANAGRVDCAVRDATGRSRAEVRGLIQHDCVKVNGTTCASDFDRVAVGDVVTVTYDRNRTYPEKHRQKDNKPFSVLFEDEHLLVVDKAAHLLTVPTPAREKDTLVHHLQAHVSRGRKHLARLAIVHRLDRGVSGALVFAKTEAVGELLRQQFAAARPERHYVALVAGCMPSDHGVFNKNLVVDKRVIHRRCASAPGEGERAVTHYVVEKRMPGFTRVRVRLETGRRNQIRVHFADAGHPVLGDPRYGEGKAKHRLWPYQRMALHAASLAFTHPVTGSALRFEAPEPEEFAIAERNHTA